MKILISSNYQWPHLGGIEIICEQLKRSWKRHGHTVTWITADIPKDGAESTEENVRLPAWNFFEDRLQINCPMVSPFAFWRILKIVKQHDAVNVHSLAPGLTTLVILAALLAKKPLVITQQIGVIPLSSSVLNHLQKAFTSFMARFSISRGAWITFPVAGLMDYFHHEAQLPMERLGVTANAHDKEDFYYADAEERSRSIKVLELPPDRFKVLFVGRFVDKKGLSYIEALARACPQIHFTLVGHGIRNPEHWGLPNVQRVSPLPPERLRAYFSAHDLLLLPSVGEGWPLVICEAMACGVPCLISKETFKYFGQDEEMFLVSDLDQESLTAQLRECESGTVPLIEKRLQISDYANAKWDWDQSASHILALFNQ